MVVPRNQNGSTVQCCSRWRVGGVQGGSPKAHYHLHCFEHGDTCGTCCLLYGVSCLYRNLPLNINDIGFLQNENNYDTIIQ